MLKVGVIGLGDISFIHLNGINNSKVAKLVSVCDIDSSNNKYPDVSFYTDYKEMLEKEELDIVHVCLPHYLHLPVAKDIIRAGVNVILEKPVGLNFGEAKELDEFAKKYPQVKVSICMQNRLNETVEMLLEIIKSEKYGKVLSSKGLVTWSRTQEYYDAKPWRGVSKLSGGGAMINQSIHTLDILQLIGGEIDSVKGVISNLAELDTEVEDTAVANIKFSNGTNGIYFVTTAYGTNSSVEIQVALEKAMLTIRDQILYLTDESGEQSFLLEDEKLAGTKFYYGASHSKLINNFYSSVINNTQDYIKIEDSFGSIKLIDGIKKSNETGKSVKMEEI